MTKGNDIDKALREATQRRLAKRVARAAADPTLDAQRTRAAIRQGS